MATDFPKKGDDKKVSLRNSEYERFPLEFAQNVKEQTPEIWKAGGNIEGNRSFRILEDHIERCLSADLSYPIIVWDGRILDGCHRAIKTLAKGRSEIKAKVIRDIPPPDFIIQAKDIMSFKNKHNFKDIVILVKNKLNQ